MKKLRLELPHTHPQGKGSVPVEKFFPFPGWGRCKPV
jgi:hypothetical protein